MRILPPGIQRYRFLILPISAAIIAGLCIWKANQPRMQPNVSQDATTVDRPAPAFSVYDARKPQRLVRLASYLGRHRILLVFFDGTQPFDHDPHIQKLTEHADALQSQGIQIFAVSSALPQTNRKRMETLDTDDPRWPFPILSDPTFATQREYGRVEKSAASATNDPRNLREQPGVFLIDRAGRVPYRNNQPVPLAEPLQTIDALATGSDAGLVSSAIAD